MGEDELEPSPTAFVDNDVVVNKPTNSCVQDLYRVRGYLFDQNEELLHILREIRSLRLQRAIIRCSIDEEEHQRQHNVWVPPSRCGGTSKHSRIRDKENKKRTHEENRDRVENLKREYAAISRQVRRLGLKRVFYVWRMKSILQREMEAMMTSIEKYNHMNWLRTFFVRWKDVAEPWTYDPEVLEQVEIFRQVSELGYQDRVIQAWRELVYYRKDMKDREDTFIRLCCHRLMKDALVQWKVYRVVHHLNERQLQLAKTFDYLRRCKQVFAYWINRIRRRMAIQEKMRYFAFQTLPQREQQLTVDDLLLLGTQKRVFVYRIVSNDSKFCSELRGIRDDARKLKEASQRICPRIRWRNLDRIKFINYSRQSIQYHPDKDTEHEPSGESNLSLELTKYQNENECLHREQISVRNEIDDLSKYLPRYEQKHNAALRKLHEYERAASELDDVKQKVQRHLDKLRDAAYQRESEYCELVSHRKHLEQVHQTMSDALAMARTNALSHSASIEKVSNDINEWKTKVRRHSRATITGNANNKNVEYVATVKLQEAEDRLNRSERRLHKLIESQKDVRSAQLHASIAEREAMTDLENAQEACDKARCASDQAQDMVDSLSDQLVALEQDYDSIMSHLNQWLEKVDVSRNRLGAILNDISTLEARLASLEEGIQVNEKHLESLEAEDRLLQKAAKECAIDQNSHEVKSSCYSEDPSRTVILKQGYFIPGDRMLMESARCYSILRRAKQYFQVWRRRAQDTHMAFDKINRRYISQYLSEPFSMWKTFVHEKMQSMQEVHSHKVCTLIIKIWKERVEMKKRHYLRIQSYHALRCVKAKQMVLECWREHAYVEREGSDAECHLKNQLMCKLFHFWREETSTNIDLETRHAAFCNQRSQRSLRRFLIEWKLATSRRQLLSRVFDHACHAWSIRVTEERYFADAAMVLTDCISAWSRYVHISREERHLDGICERIRGIRQATLQKLVLKQWHDTSNASMEHRKNIAKSIGLAKDTMIKRRCLEYLRIYTNERILKISSLRVTWAFDHPRKHALDAWLHVVQRSKQQKTIKEKCHALRHVLHMPTSERMKCLQDIEEGHIRAVRTRVATAMHDIVSSISPEKKVDQALVMPSPNDVTAISV